MKPTKKEQSKLEEIIREIRVLYKEQIRQYDVCLKMNNDIQQYLDEGKVKKIENAERIMRCNETKMQSIVEYICNDYYRIEELVWNL